jgi:hypothetical protein
MASKKASAFPAKVDDRTAGGVLSKHVSELTGHLLDSADYNAHGHAQGRQGRAGHEMVPNNLHLQGDAHIPQAALKDLPQNRQNAFSESGSADASADRTGDYGSADKNG